MDHSTRQPAMGAKGSADEALVDRIHRAQRTGLDIPGLQIVITDGATTYTEWAGGVVVARCMAVQWDPSCPESVGRAIRIADQQMVGR